MLNYAKVAWHLYIYLRDENLETLFLRFINYALPWKTSTIKLLDLHTTPRPALLA